MKHIFIILLLFIGAMPMGSVAAEDVEWARANKYTLHLHDRFSKEGFVVEACNFNVDRGLVLLKIYHGEEVVVTDALTGDESINYNDEIKVTVVNVTGYKVLWSDEVDNPRAAIEVRLRARPNIGLSISTDKEEYDTDDNVIHAEVFLKNNGTCNIEDVNLDIKTDGMRTSSNLVRKFDEISRRRSETIDIYIEIPHLMDNRSFEISATASGRGWDGKKYIASASKSITVLLCWEMFEVEKTVTESVYLHGGRFNYNDSNSSTVSCAFVNLTIFNPGLIDISCIELTDNLPENFVLEDGSRLKWKLNLTSKEKKQFSYSMKPLSYGIYDIPVATANWSLCEKNYSVLSISNQSQIIAHAACIDLTKTVNQTEISCGDELTVTVRIQNTGNLQATVNASDTIPENAILLGGTTSLKRVILKEGGIQRFIYRIRINSTGGTILPPAKVSFTDLYGYEDTTTSDTVTINVIDTGWNSENTTQTITNETKIPAIEMISAFVRRIFGFVL